jgi:hypothetical protein
MEEDNNIQIMDMNKKSTPSYLDMDPSGTNNASKDMGHHFLPE